MRVLYSGTNSINIQLYFSATKKSDCCGMFSIMIKEPSVWEVNEDGLLCSSFDIICNFDREAVSLHVKL